MLKKYRISNWFLLGLLCWVTIIIFRRNGMIIPVVNGYFTDVITIPMYCYLIKYMMNKVMGFPWEPNLEFIISSFVYISVLFEVICPLISDQFTGDILDVLAYFAGGMSYYFFKNKKQQSKLLFSKFF